MLNSTNKAVSAKIRIGFDGTSINALKVAKLIEREGADFMTIHGRTVHAKYSGDNNLDVICLVKQKIDIPIIGNGDIIDGISARRMLEKTKCDLIMVGRAAIGYPNIFQEINQFLKGLRVHTLSKENYKKVLQDYFTLLQDTHPNEQKDPTFFIKKLEKFLRPKLCEKNLKERIREQPTIPELEKLLFS